MNARETLAGIKARAASVASVTGNHDAMGPRFRDKAFALAEEDVPRLTAALEVVLTAAEGRAHTLRHTADRLNQQCLDRDPDRDYDAAIRYEHYALEAESTHIRITALIEKALTD